MVDGAVMTTVGDVGDAGEETEIVCLAAAFQVEHLVSALERIVHLALIVLVPMIVMLEPTDKERDEFCRAADDRPTKLGKMRMVESSTH